MNGDAQLDLVVTLAAEGAGHVDVLLGNGDGTFVYDPEGGRNLSAGSFGVGVADFNGDTKLDVVATTVDDEPTTQDPVFLLLGDGAGGLGRAAPFPTGSGLFGLALADLTGDTLPDVLTADGDDSQTSACCATTAPADSPHRSRFRSAPAPSRCSRRRLDDDAHLDALTANVGSGDVSGAAR